MKSKYNRLSRLNQIVLAVAATGALMSSAYATTTYTWTSATTNGLWSASGNWDSNGIPASDVANSAVAINPGAVTLTSKVDAGWNSSNTNSINSLTFSSGTITLANNVAGTNLTLGSGGFINNSGNAAVINFRNAVGGTLTTSGSQTWTLNGKAFTFSGNINGGSGDVLTIDPGAIGSYAGASISGDYTTTYAGTLKLLPNPTATLRTVFGNPKASSTTHDRWANLVIDLNNNGQMSQVVWDYLNDNYTIPTNITFQNISAGNSSIASISAASQTFNNAWGSLATSSASPVSIHLGLCANYTGNWSGNVSKANNSAIYAPISFNSTGGAYKLSGDNSGLTYSQNDPAHGYAAFNSDGAGIIANNANALGTNNTLGVNLGMSNANVQLGFCGLYATPASSGVRSDISVLGSNFTNNSNHAQQGFVNLGLLPTAANTDSVTYSGNIYASTNRYSQHVVRFVNGLTNDSSHGGDLVITGAIQDQILSYNTLTSNQNLSPVQFLGTGTFELNGANVYAGDTSVRSGTVLVGSSTPAGYVVGTGSTVPRLVDAWGGSYTMPIGTTQVHLASIAGLYVGQPFGNVSLGFQPGTVITQIGVTGDPLKVVISKPTVAVIDNHGGPPVPAGGAFGLVNTAISLGDSVPQSMDVKTCSPCYNWNPGGTWSAGTYTFTGSAALSFNGLSLSVGDKVLVWSISWAAQQNGIYQVTDSTHWARVSGLDTTAGVLANQRMRVHVTGGTWAGQYFEMAPIYSASGWTLNSDGTTAGTFGPIAFVADVGNPNVGILTNGAYTIGRPINVTNNQSSGTSSLGGNTANASTFSGLVTLSKDLSLTAASSGTVTFSGDITGSNNVNKVGSGTVKFSTAKSYTGTTTVSAGTLEVDNTIASSGVTVGTGGTLQGTGTVTNTLSVTGTGVVSPGLVAVGALYAGDTTISGHLAANVDDLSTNELISTGTINLTGGTVDVTVGGGGFTQPYYVIAAASTITGTPSVTTGYTLTNTGTELRLSLTPTTHSISGTVTRSGSALSGVTVSDGTRTATTDGSGAYTITSVPDSATYTVTPSLTGYTFSPANQSVTLSGSDVTGINFAVANAYGNWATIHGLSGADAATTANPSHDGLSNLVKYALDLNPAVSAQPAGTLSGSTLSFTKGAMAKADSNLVYSIEESTDLTTWTAPTGSSPSGSVSNLTNTITYTFPSGQTKVFARLKVVQNP